MLRRLLIFLCLMLASTFAEARGITPELVAEGAAPAGGEVELAIHMRPAPGWHGYWLNPGDAGLPMDVKWQLPKGFSTGPLRYPVPTRLTVAGLMNYVFEHDYAVLVRLKVPAGATGTVPIRAEAHWLACTDKICVPEQGQLALDVPVGNGAPNRAEFDRWRKQLAQPIATVGHFAADAGKLEVAIPLPANVVVGEPYLFPITDNVIDYEAPQAFRRSGDWLVAELKTTKPPGAIRGGSRLGRRTRSRIPCCAWRRAAGRNATRRLRLERGAMGSAGCDCRRHPAQFDAVRLPDPGAEGPALVTRGRFGA